MDLLLVAYVINLYLQNRSLGQQCSLLMLD